MARRLPDRDTTCPLFTSHQDSSYLHISPHLESVCTQIKFNTRSRGRQEHLALSVCMCNCFPACDDVVTSEPCLAAGTPPLPAGNASGTARGLWGCTQLCPPSPGAAPSTCPAPSRYRSSARVPWAKCQATRDPQPKTHGSVQVGRPECAPAGGSCGTSGPRRPRHCPTRSGADLSLDLAVDRRRFQSHSRGTVS